MSFRNRCVLAGGAGKVNLSVPLVEGRNQRRPLKEVRIDNKTGWQGQHWKTITSCYNRSPWFEFYKHELEELYRRPVELLVDWNRICWDWLMEKLDAGVLTSYTEEFQAENEKAEFQTRSDAQEFHTKNDSPEFQPGNNPLDFHGKSEPSEFLDWRNKLMPRSIQKEFPEPVRYRQVFEDRVGFIPHLSILDLLFCEGPRTVEILKSSKIPI